MAGVHLPVQPMKHHYLITEDTPLIAERMQSGERLPTGTDYEANIYFRQERNGMLLGTYEPRSTPWQVGGTPADFGHELLTPDLDRIADRLALAFERIPRTGGYWHQDRREWYFYFWSRRQSDGWPGAWHEQLLGCGGRDGWVLSGRWRRSRSGRVDDPRGAIDRRVGDGHRPLWQFRKSGLGRRQVLRER